MPGITLQLGPVLFNRQNAEAQKRSYCMNFSCWLDLCRFELAAERLRFPLKNLPTTGSHYVWLLVVAAWYGMQRSESNASTATHYQFRGIPWRLLGVPWEFGDCTSWRCQHRDVRRPPTKSRGRRDYNLGQYCPQRCHLLFFLAARLETLVRSGHLGANPVGSKPQQRSDTHLGHISETEAVPEERTESEGKRNNISGSERLSPKTWPLPARETEVGIKKRMMKKKTVMKNIW